MASVVKIKRSSVAGKLPTTLNLHAGELAINLADGRLYSSNGTNVFEIGANVASLAVGNGAFSIANGAMTFPLTDGTANQVLSTDGEGQIVWADSAATLDDVVQNGNTTFLAIDVGGLTVNNMVFPSANGVTGQVLSLNANGDLNFVDVATTLDAVIANGNTTSREITVGGINISNNFILPKVDGSADQVLTTDGSGNVTWQDQSGGAAEGYIYDYQLYTVGANTAKFRIGHPAGTTLNVFHNGLKLANNDYTSNTTVVTLNVPATAGDTLELQSAAVSASTDRAYKRFKFTANTGQTLFAGTDDDGKILDHDLTDVEIYLNGVLLANSDYDAHTSKYQVTLTDAASADDELTVISISPVTNFVTVDAAITTNSYSFSSTVESVVDMFNKSEYRTAKYIVQLVDSTNSKYQSSEVLLTHDGTDVYMTTYATVDSDGEIGTYDSDISGTWVRFKVTPSTATTAVKVIRTMVTA
jgi:hypothetical protein